MNLQFSLRPKQRGISLIELIMFIVIIGIALAGILGVMNIVTGHSADPLIRKQSLAIAESLLEEVELMPFTFCDPDDANAVTAASLAGSCADPANEESTTIGFEAGESRYVPPHYDNVSDYHGFNMVAGSILDITGSNIGLNGYTAQIAVVPTAIPLVGAAPAIAATESLLIRVTVTGPDNEPVVIEGYRTRYAPRSVP